MILHFQSEMLMHKFGLQLVLQYFEIIHFQTFIFVNLNEVEQVVPNMVSLINFVNGSQAIFTVEVKLINGILYNHFEFPLAFQNINHDEFTLVFFSMPFVKKSFSFLLI